MSALLLTLRRLGQFPVSGLLESVGRLPPSSDKPHWMRHLQAMDLWAHHAGVQIDFSRPGKPTDNVYVDSFNVTLRAECLDTHWFASLSDAKQVVGAWRREYNESRPHRAHGEKTPHEFRATATDGNSL